jgi:hypothetical protein
MPVFMTSEVLTALAGTLFPMIASASSTPNESPFNSPDKEQPLTGIVSASSYFIHNWKQIIRDNIHHTSFSL